jgi:hypothetical protein
MFMEAQGKLESSATGSQSGTFSLDPGSYPLNVPQWLAHSGRIQVPHYFGFFAGFLILLVLLQFPVRRALLAQAASEGKKGQVLDRQVRLVTFIMTLFTTFFGIWIWTVFHESAAPIWILIRLALAIVVVPSILFLEALALAVIELEDKQLPEPASGDREAQQVDDIMKAYKSDSGAYIRAREWLLALLIILFTILVEFEKYDIPFVGSYEGSLARIVMTFILATVAVIWISQSPGKEIGRKSPYRFLSLVIGPMWVHKAILFLSRVAQQICIDKPSEVTASFFTRLFNLSSEEPLPPSGERLFAEMIKRYGYGDCEIHQKYSIDDLGAAVLDQTETVYIGKGKKDSYLRLLISEVEFKEKPVVVSKEAFIVKELGASIDEDLKDWNGPRTRVDETVPEMQIDTDVRWLNGDRKIAEVRVTLMDRKLKKRQAFVLKVGIRAVMERGSFKGPKTPGRDWWSRKLAKPCYLADTTLKLDSASGEGKFKNVGFEVTQEEQRKVIRHEPETERFTTLQRDQDDKNRLDKKPQTWFGVSEDGRSLSVKLTQGLPGAKYQVTWEMIESEIRPDSDQFVPPPVIASSNGVAPEQLLSPLSGAIEAKLVNAAVIKSNETGPVNALDANSSAAPDAR